MIVFVVFLIAAASASPYLWKRVSIGGYGFLLQPCDPVALDCLKAGPLFAFYPYGYGIGAGSAQAQAGSYSGGHGGGSSSQAIAASQSQSGHGIESSGASASSQAQSIGYPLGRSRRGSSDEEATEMRYKGPHHGPDTLSRRTESVKPVYESEPYDEENLEDIASSHPKPIITTHGAMSGSCASGLCTPLIKGGEAITSSVISGPSPLVGPNVRDASENEEVSDAHAIPEEEFRETDILDPLYIRTPSEHSTRDTRCTTCADALSTTSASASGGVTEQTPAWEKTRGGNGGFGGSQSSSGSLSQASAGSGSHSSSGGLSSNTGFGGGSTGSSSFSSAGASTSGSGGSVVSGAGTCTTGLGGCIGTGTGYSSGSGGFGVIQSSIGSQPNQGFSSGSPIKPGFVVSQGYGSGSQGYGGSSQGYGGVSQGYGGSSQGYGGVSQGYGGSSQGYSGVSQGFGSSSSYGGYSGSTYQSSPIPPLGNQGSSGFISGVSTIRPASAGGSFGPVSSFGSGGNLVSGTGSQFSAGGSSGANSGAQTGGLSGPQVFPTGGSFTPVVGTPTIGGSSGSLSGAGANSGANSFGGGSQNSGIGGGFSGAQSGGGAGGFGSLSGVSSPIISGSAFNTASSSSSSSSSSSNSDTSSSGFFGASFGR